MSSWRDVAKEVLAKHGAVRPFSRCDFGREDNADCVSVVIPNYAEIMVGEEAIAVLRRVRRALPENTVAWLGTTRWLGADRDDNEGKVELAVGPGEDQFDILRHARSDACNYGMQTEDLVQRLREYDARYGIDIVHAETDTIELDLVRAVDDWGALAERLYELCPDIVDQGVGSVEALAEALADSNRVYLWWD